MGREVRRVPLDFAWPIDKTWDGFLMPESLRGRKCADCEGGQNHAGWWLQRFCQRLTMLADDIADQERGSPLHPWLAGDPYPHGRFVDGQYEVIRPSADIRTLMDGLIGETNRGPFGYTGTDYRVYRAIVNAAGLDSWGGCETCDGEGTMETYPGQRAEADAWEATDPPTGEGWQLWETVSEGSPISPVFDSPEGLARWMSSDAYHWGASRPMQYDAALRFVNDGWAPSFVATAETGLIPGEEFVGRDL